MTSKHTQNQQIASMRDSLLKKGFLNEQFIQLEQVEDAGNPDFVEEIYNLFFRDSVKYLDNIEQLLENGGNGPLNFAILDSQMYRFSGASSSVGAAKVKDQAKLFRECCDNGNVEGLRTAFEQVKKEMAILKEKMESFFRLIRLTGPAEPAVRPK